MALTPEEEAELAELEKQVGPEFLKAGGSVTPAPENSLGVTGVINQPQADPAHEESEVGRIASALDPRFDLIPQGLALLPATNHPQGDEAAIASYKAGTTGDVKFAYEPPLAVVKKQLLENPNMLGLLRSDPPSAEEIAAMDADSPLYQDAANYMWARTAEAAGQKGYTVYRYSKMPWGKENDTAGGLGALGLKLGGMMQPIRDVGQAIILGADDVGTLGASRAFDEALGDRKMNVSGNADVMGLNEEAKHDPAFLNQSLIGEHPLAYGGGQVVGALGGAPTAVYQGILAGGSKLAQLVTKTRLGALAAKAPNAVKGAAALAGEVGAGTAEAVATQAGQEAIDMVTPGREPVLGPGERIMDTGQSAALWGLGGGTLGRLAGAGADAIRNADSLGGAIGRTESNLRYGPLSPLLGPSLSGDAKDLVRLGNKTRTEPGDFIAEQIAPPIRKAAEARTRAAEGTQRAERANAQASDLGQEPLPLTGLQTMSLEKLRAHHQPLPEGGLHPVDDKHREAQKVFNRLTKDVSLEPIEGATKLSADEAGAFLGHRQRYELLKADIDAAAARQSKQVIDRKAYLQTLDPKKRAAADEEIQASIDDLLQQKREGDRALDIDQRSAAYKAAEAQVLRERVGEEMVLEPFDGSFAGYLKQRGIDGVYVTPHAYDAKRTDTLIEGLTDKELLEAAKHDRAQRVHGGERGGYAKMHDRHAEEIGKAKKVEESIAPKGDAFRAVALQGNRPQAGGKQEADVISGLADEAGVRGDLDRLRGFQDARDIQRQAWFRSPKGSPRGVGIHSVADAAKIRAFPILRSLEPGGAVTGGQMSRMALMGQIEDEKARSAEVERKKPAYDERRSKLQKKKDAEREKERKERERRATEKHRDD
jgi:hypothetical protein